MRPDMHAAIADTLPRSARTSAVAGLSTLIALYCLKLFGAWYFHKYDWDMVEVVLLRLARHLPIEVDPYSFLLPYLVYALGWLISAQQTFLILLAAFQAIYIAGGWIIYRITSDWTGNRTAAIAAAAVWYSAYCITYVSSYLDDNLMQILCVLLAAWALFAGTNERARYWGSAALFAASCCFHLQSFALFPAFLFAIWAGENRGQVRRVLIWGGTVIAIYAVALVWLVDVGELIRVVRGATERGPGAFVVSTDEVGLFGLFGRGMVATLLPFPVHVRALYGRPLFGVVEALGIAYVAAIALPAMLGAARASGVDATRFRRLGFLSLGLLGAAVFAWLAEPDGTERWVSAAPFFALAAGDLVARLRRSASSAAHAAAGAVAALVIAFAVLAGKVALFAAFPDDRRVVTAGLMHAIASELSSEDVIVVEEGFDLLPLYRRPRSCVYVYEYGKDQVKCWDRAGVAHLPRGDTAILGAGRAAVQTELVPYHPEMAAGTLRTICDPFPLSALFGKARCVDFRLMPVREARPVAR